MLDLFQTGRLPLLLLISVQGPHSDLLVDIFLSFGAKSPDSLKFPFLIPFGFMYQEAEREAASYRQSSGRTRMLDPVCLHKIQKVVVAGQVRQARTAFQNERLYRICVTYNPAPGFSKRLCYCPWFRTHFQYVQNLVSCFAVSFGRQLRNHEQ